MCIVCLRLWLTLANHNIKRPLAHIVRQGATQIGLACILYTEFSMRLLFGCLFGADTMVGEWKLAECQAKFPKATYLKYIRDFSSFQYQFPALPFSASTLYHPEMIR